MPHDWLMIDASLSSYTEKAPHLFLNFDRVDVNFIKFKFAYWRHQINKKQMKWSYYYA